MVRPVISVPEQGVQFAPSVEYSIAAVMPVILPSLPFSEVGATPTSPAGAAGPSALPMLHAISFAAVVSSLHL